MTTHIDSNACLDRRGYLTSLRSRTTLNQIQAHIDALGALRVLVVGDLIVDEYCHCQVSGTVTKSPVIAAIYESSHQMAGGGAVVARHAREVAKKVDYIATVGTRNDQHKFVETIFDREGIGHRFFSWPDSFTVVKRRYISGAYPTTLSNKDVGTQRPNIRLFEIGYMPRSLMPASVEAEICAELERRLGEYDVVIVADFGHGAITPKIAKTIATHAKWWAVNAQTNSSNFGFNRITKYTGAHFVCIDELEARLPMGDKVSPFEDVAGGLREQLRCGSLLVTRGSLGLMFFKGNHVECAPALVERVIDTVGAGDAVLAVASLAECAQLPADVTTLLGACYGGIASLTVGNEEPVRRSALNKFLTEIFE